MPSIRFSYGASGPILDVFVGVSEPRQSLMRRLGHDVPPALRLSLIVDTGADTTMISEQHMRTLAIPPSGATNILTSTSGTTPTSCDTYDVKLQISTLGDEPFIVPALEVLARPLFNHSIDGMIGRDVLSKLVLTIDGPGQRITMQY